MLQLAQIEDAVNQTLRKSTQAVSLHALNSKPQQLRILLLVMLIADAMLGMEMAKPVHGQQP